MFLRMGYSEEIAESIAYSSNYVDTNNWTPLPEDYLYAKNLVPDKNLRDSRRLLHNLGNLEPAQIVCYRKCVLGLAQENQGDPHLLGALLHVLGDTYAHRKKDGRGYGNYLGHAGAGTSPDDVRSDEYFGQERFSHFGLSIYKNFALKDATPPELFYIILYSKDRDGKYKLPDRYVEGAFKAFAGKSMDHTIDTAQNEALDAKISYLLPSLEVCYEKARGIK